MTPEPLKNKLVDIEQEWLFNLINATIITNPHVSREWLAQHVGYQIKIKIMEEMDSAVGYLCEEVDRLWNRQDKPCTQQDIYEAISRAFADLNGVEGYCVCDKEMYGKGYSDERNDEIYCSKECADKHHRGDII